MIIQFGFFFGGGATTTTTPSFAIVLLVSFAVYFLSFFLMLALSRYREFARRPRRRDHHRPPERARLGAHEDLRRDAAGAADQDLRQAERMNAFFIVPTEREERVTTLFSTHPPMEKRIERAAAARGAAPGRARRSPPSSWASSTRLLGGSGSSRARPRTACSR